MRGAYINTRRVAPKGYVAVTKKLAERLYDEGKLIRLCGNKVRSWHVFGGWCLGMTACNQAAGSYDYTFNELCENFLSYLDRELGSYIVFYVKHGDLYNG